LIEILRVYLGSLAVRRKSGFNRDLENFNPQS